MASHIRQVSTAQSGLGVSRASRGSNNPATQHLLNGRPRATPRSVEEVQAELLSLVERSSESAKAAALAKVAQAPAVQGKQRTMQLKGPESTRKLPKAEQILILQASKFNGQKFPPWTRVPVPEDFWLRPSENMFRYQESAGVQQVDSDTALYREIGDMTLSKHQKDNLEGWMRARDALPPPSWFPNRSGLQPTMLPIKPIDLVQDAASDCSVVASLCAERARAENGHGSVGVLFKSLNACR